MRPITRCHAAIAAFLLVPAVIASAQSAAQPAIEGAVPANSIDPVDAAKYLGTAYKKESDGFRLTPPAGSKLINRQGIDLVSFVVDAKSWGGSLQRITVNKPITLDDFIATTKADITRDTRSAGANGNPNQPVNIFKGVQILEDKRLKKGPYDAALFTFSAQIDLGPMVPDAVAQQMGLSRPTGAPNAVQTVSLLRQELIVRIKDGVFDVLMLYTPLADRDTAERTWNLMLPEFEIFDGSAMLKRRVEAAKTGREWLSQRSAEELRGKLINDAQFFRMTVGNKDIGFFHFNELTKESGPGGSIVDVTRDGHTGVLVTVNQISFADNGAVNVGQNEAFWSYSKDSRGDATPAYSSWQNTSEIKTKVITAAPGRPGVPTMQEITPWLQESGILSQTGLPGPKVPFQINVLLAGDREQRVSNGVNAIVPLDGAPALPKILEYTWTRFVDLTKPSEMTFSAFDSKSRKMSTRNLIVTGTKQNVNIDGKIETCFKCVDEADPYSTTLWVDASGKIRSMVTSDQSVMIPTTETAMKARWAKQLAELSR